MDLINAGIFHIYNFFSDIILHTKDRKYLKILRKNNSIPKANSKTCFILGNGPSIKDVDLKQISEYDIFTVNYFHKSEQSNQINTKYHILVDEIFYESEGLEYAKNLIQTKKELSFFVRHHAYTKYNKLFDNDKIFYMYQKKMQVGKKINYDITKNSDACINVLISAIEIAMFLGYKSIYLLGCDYNSYCSNTENHFYKDDTVKKICIGDELKYYALAHKHLYALQDYCEKKGIGILNLTENSLIDAFEKRSLKEVLNCLNQKDIHIGD